VAGTLAPAAAQRCTQDCIQVHGGIGFTWEHDTNIYYRRALVLAAGFGRKSEYPQRVVDTAAGTGMRKLDIDLDPDTEKLRTRSVPRLPRSRRYPVRSARSPSRGRVGAAPSAHTLGAGGQPRGADHHRPGVHRRAGAAADDRHRGLDRAIDRGLRHRRAKTTFPAADVSRRNDLVPAFSEPGAGSDLAGLSTKATKTDGGWRITGQKIWTTAAQLSQWGALLARTDPSAPKHNGITYFLLDMKSEGVEVKPLRELTGGAMFNTVFIDDVFVPDELVLGEVNRGWEVSRNTLTAERVSIGSSEAPFLANLEQFVESFATGSSTRSRQNRAGQLIARGHAGQGAQYAFDAPDVGRGDARCRQRQSPSCCRCAPDRATPELGVSTFGSDGRDRRPRRAGREVAEILLASPGHHYLRRHVGGAAQHHRRTAPGAAARPVNDKAGTRRT